MISSNRKSAKQSSLVWLLVACLVVSLLPACGARRTPNLARIFADASTRTGKRPLIIIPGVLGSRLVNNRTGEIVWESAFRSKVDDIGLPVSPDIRSNRDDLIPQRIIEVARFLRAAPEIYVYRELLNAMRDFGGYREGDWANPALDGDRDTYYVFPYDWRRDNVESAAELVRRIEELKTRLNRPDLRFNIVAHSMGGLVARYAAMYGAEDLPVDETPKVTWAGAKHINNIFMFGTPNQGSADALATLIDGYSIREGLRPRLRLFRNLTSEDALTLPAIYQLLPHAHAAKFLDENLQPVDVDLYDPATWQRYGWGAISDEDFRRRFVERELNRKAGVEDKKTNAPTNPNERQAAREAAEPFAPSTLETLDAYFAAVLKRARRFHEALDAPVAANAPVKLYLFGGDCEETLNAPIIIREPKTGRYRTLIEPRSFTNSVNQKFTRKQVTLAMYEPGDGRVTRNSQMGADEDAINIVYTVFACDLHGDVQKNKILQDNALTVLVGEAMK